jgi:uncharacterized membrane protein YbhN (UPF0104 family)
MSEDPPTTAPATRGAAAPDRAGANAGSSADGSGRGEAVPEHLHPRRVRRRLLEVALVVGVIAVVLIVGPGLDTVRDRLANASIGWVIAGVPLEVLSALCYVVIFRAVFCRRMSWRLSYQIGMSEQGANSVLSVSGAGGLALGVWALRRGGMSVEHIARRTVAFFFLTSMANVGGVILFAALYPTGVLGRDHDAPLTYGFGAAALLGTAIVLALPAVLARRPGFEGGRSDGRLARAVRFARFSIGQGLRDAVVLLRQRPLGVIGGSLGTMAFDLAVLAATFKAFGYSPPFGVLVLGYLIGQLGGNIPVPGGIGGLDAGLIGAFALYHQPIVQTTAAVLIYHVISLWVPALLGSFAFIQLRHTLERDHRAAAMCEPLSDPIRRAPRRRQHALTP